MEMLALVAIFNGNVDILLEEMTNTLVSSGAFSTWKSAPEVRIDAKLWCTFS
jgi:hypothetical protein